MTDAWPPPPQPDVFREGTWVMPKVILPEGFEPPSAAVMALGPRWNSDHEWTVAKVHAKQHGRKEPDDVDLAFARAVLAELGE